MRKDQRLLRLRQNPPRPQMTQQRRQNARVLACLGSLLVGAALIFRFVGFYRAARAFGSMNFTGMNDQREVTKALTAVTQKMALAGDMLELGNIVLLVGGAMLTHAWMHGRLRERWLFGTTLTFALLLVWQPYVGTFFGLLWFWLLALNRRQFSVQPAILVSE
ncbi:hypothetical protein [Prosthecobacter sp.]|uniref:hypothetical protein n=1 Tax=Prosthecobacter sp. TaxID=1965333 RepID=UPI003783E25C